MEHDNERSEADVGTDDKRADSREPDDTYVGRIAADDPENEETGAERRAEAAGNG